MSKKSFLEKIGLVESNEDGYDYASLKAEIGGQTTITSAPIVTVDVSGLVGVQEIYDNTNLSDMTKSIFKVKEMKDALPANLPDATKKASVIGLFSVTGLDMAVLLEDANTRIGALESTITAFTEETVAAITENDTKIAELQAKIAELQQANEDRKKLQEQQEAVIKDEVKKINDIVNFLK